MHKIEISEVNLTKLKELISALDNFYNQNENEEIEPWDLDDLHSNLDIHNDILSIIIPLIEKL